MKKIIIYFLLLMLFSCQKNVSLNETVVQDKNIKTKTILALWDSVTAWYNLPLEDSYPLQLQKILNDNWYNYEVINWWVSWNNSEQLLERVDLYLNDKDLPKIVIIVIWWNDWLRWNSIEELSLNLEKIINKFKEKKVEVVLWWMKIPPNLWLSYSSDFSSIFKKVADKTGVYLIDFFLEWVAWKSNLNLNDWLHPNKQWYAIVSKNVFDFLKNNNLIKKWLK